MKEKLNEVIRFAIVGVLATLIQYAIYYVLLPYMDISSVFAVTMS